MIQGKDIAKCAMLSTWDRFTYSHLDCQAFVEAVLKEVGIRKKDGTVFNWKGSNSMYRNYYYWRGTISECIKKYGSIPLGAFVYIRKDSGDNYNDGLGNFSHVGLYVGNDKVRDSTRSTKTGRDGVGTRSISGFTHVSLLSGVDYANSSGDKTLDILEILDKIEKDINDIRNLLGENK